MAMHLSDYSSFFEPEEFCTLTAAYEATWQHLATNKLALPDDQVLALKSNLAQIILASACNGNRDARALRDIALRGLSARAGAHPTQPN